MSSPAPLPPGTHLSVRRQRQVLSVIVFSAVIIWLDTTILGIALERLADPVRGLGASPGALQWAVGLYSLTFATALFAAGALGDRYGYRRVLAVGMATFGIASACAAWSSTATELVLARGLMGIGGAMIMPTSVAILMAVFPPERRAGAIGAFSASSGVGVAAGPLLGGVLLDHFWWGSVFLVNLPIVVFGLVGVAVFVPAPRRPASQSGPAGHGAPRRRRADLPGLLLSTAALLSLAYGLIEGGQTTRWGRWQVWGSMAAGVAVLAAFVVVEMRAREPSFDPRLFRNRRFAAGNVALAAMFFAITGQMFYATFYLQGARGMSALDTGLLALPAALGVIAGAQIGVRLARRFGVAAVAGPGLMAVALAFAANLTYGLGTSLSWYAVVGAVNGLGIGLTVAPTSAAVLATLPMDRTGAGSAVNNTLRQVGGVLGVAVLGTILSAAYRRDIHPALRGLPAPARASARPSAEATRHVARVLGRPDLVAAADHAFVHAMHLTALTAAAIALAGAGILIAAFRRQAPPTPPVRGTSTAPVASQPAAPAAAGAGRQPDATTGT